MGEIEEWGERVFALTVAVLDQRGRSEIVQLLLDAERFEMVFTEHDWNEDWHRLTLDVADHLVPKFTDDVKKEIGQVAAEVAGRIGSSVENEVNVRMTLPQVDTNWRTIYTARLHGERPTNQARKERLTASYPAEDGLFFGSAEELRVYRCLKEIQRQTPEDRTFAISPLPGIHLREGHTWTPDLLVVGNGRAVIIEIDGPHHRQPRRYGSDRNRDLQWLRCRIPTVRLLVEDHPEDSALNIRLREELRRALWPSS